MNVAMKRRFGQIVSGTRWGSAFWGVLMLSMASGCGHAVDDAARDPVASMQVSAFDRARLALMPTPPFACSAACKRDALDFMITRAEGGDVAALLTLEMMRRSGHPLAPSLDDIIAIERKRALRGDSLTAWRLAERYRNADGVEADQREMVRWLKVVARAREGSSPKSGDAAFRLCELYAAGEIRDGGVRQARYWCRLAARRGHAGAVLALAQLDGRV